MKEQKYLLLVLVILIYILVTVIMSPRYQFFPLKLSNGYIQLRGDTWTGELEQIYIAN